MHTNPPLREMRDKLHRNAGENAATRVWINKHDQVVGLITCRICRWKPKAHKVVRGQGSSCSTWLLDRWAEHLIDRHPNEAQIDWLITTDKNDPLREMGFSEVDIANWKDPEYWKNKQYG